MYRYSRLRTAMQGYVRLCRAYVQLRTAMYGYVCPCMAMHGMVRLFKAMQGYVEVMYG